MIVRIIDPYDNKPVHYDWIKSHRWDNGTYQETYYTAILNALASAYSLQEMGGTTDETWEQLRDRTLFEFIYMIRFEKMDLQPQFTFVADETFFRLVDLKMLIRKTISEDITY